MTQQYNQSEEMITIDDSGSEDDDTYVPDCCEEEDYNLAQGMYFDQSLFTNTSKGPIR